MFLLMSGTNNFAKKYFLTPFWDSTKFSLFFNGRACRFSVKNSIFQKLPQMLSYQKKHFYNIWGSFLKIEFLTENRQARPLQNSENFVLSQNGVRKYFLAKLFVCFFWWVEQIILPKNIFLPHFEIVQNFHYFVRSVTVDFPSKIQFSKNSLKCCRNVSFDEWNK